VKRLMVIMAILTFVIAGSIQEASSNLPGLAYGGYSGLDVPIYGIDGYIRPSTSTTLTSDQFRGSWIIFARATAPTPALIGSS
jgi:hypothetical protein